jgi:hypothetical protein
MSDEPSSAASDERVRLARTAATTCSYGVGSSVTVRGHFRDDPVTPYVREGFALGPLWLFAAIVIVPWFFMHFVVPEIKERCLEKTAAEIHRTPVASGRVG